VISLDEEKIVTIGLCVKNCANTIGSTINSIIAQDFPHSLMEIIIVDDGCNDDTIPVIIGRLSKTDLSFKLLKTGEKGLGVARQIVVNNARGKYIVWVDGDIVIPPDHISKQVKFMESNPQIGKARAKQGWLEKETGNFLANCGLFSYIEEIKGGKQPKISGIGGSICRIDAIKDAGGFDVRIKGAMEDIDLVLRMINRGWNICVSDAIFYHEHKISWKSTWNRFKWYGYGAHYIKHKYNMKMIGLTHLPLLAILISIKKAVLAFKYTRKKQAFFLPIPYLFGSIAWWIGFIKAHIEDYHPKT
jgi:glycosyltransferase involved in cell wall biosynthesis